MFFKRATLTGSPYEHRVIFTLDGLITIVLLLRSTCINFHNFDFQEAGATSIAKAGEDGPETEKLLLLFVQRCQQNLLGLYKFITASGSASTSASSVKTKSKSAQKNSDKIDWAKKLYSQALQLPNSHADNFLNEMCNLVENLSQNVLKLK